MDDAHFDALSRSFGTAGSRRSALAAVLSGLGLLGGHALNEAAAHDLLKKCKKLKDKAKRKKCLKKAKKHNATHTTPQPPPEPAAPRLVYQCPGPFSDYVAVSSNHRLAQTFTPSQSGALRQIQFGIRNLDSGGDYVVQLLKVSGGTPAAASPISWPR